MFVLYVCSFLCTNAFLLLCPYIHCDAHKDKFIFFFRVLYVCLFLCTNAFLLLCPYIHCDAHNVLEKTFGLFSSSLFHFIYWFSFSFHILIKLLLTPIYISHFVWNLCKGVFFRMYMLFVNIVFYGNEWINETKLSLRARTNYIAKLVKCEFRHGDSRWPASQISWKNGGSKSSLRHLKWMFDCLESILMLNCF